MHLTNKREMYFLVMLASKLEKLSTFDVPVIAQPCRGIDVCFAYIIS